MVGYAVIDSLPFAMMGLLLMLGYSAAFVVLFDDDLAHDSDDNFDTLFHAIQSLFHAGLGNFETDVSSAKDEHS